MVSTVKIPGGSVEVHFLVGDMSLIIDSVSVETKAKLRVTVRNKNGDHKVIEVICWRRLVQVQRTEITVGLTGQLMYSHPVIEAVTAKYGAGRVKHSRCTEKHRLCGGEHTCPAETGGWACTRPAGHRGSHVACVPSGEDNESHNLHTWKD